MGISLTNIKKKKNRERNKMKWNDKEAPRTKLGSDWLGD